jgi:acetylglutamate kinase
VHLVDGRRHGALLLELFTRDGVGTMVARYDGALIIFFLT